MLLALEETGLRSFFQNLFELYGIYNLEDLLIIDEDVINELENIIQSNGFGGNADFASQQDQIKYLGRTVKQLSNFKFTPLDRKKMLEKLPLVVKKILEEGNLQQLKTQLKDARKRLLFHSSR